MCVIIHLLPGAEISFDKLKNATLNNPHGWGLAMKDRGKVIVDRGCPSNGNDPDELAEKLRKAVSTERVLHVRYNTVGKTSLENCHPFNLMSGKGKPDVLFFHNGTIHKYKPSATYSDASDSRNYADTFLSPLLYHFKGDKADFDYTDPFFLSLLGDTFGHMNRGLIFSSKFDPLFLGKWETITEGDHTFRASNDDYFKEAQGNRMHEDRKPQVVVRQQNPVNKATDPVAGVASTGSTKTKSQLKDVNLKRIDSKKLTTKDIERIMSWGSDTLLEDMDVEELSYFNYCLGSEIKTFVEESPTQAAALLSFFFKAYAELAEEYNVVDVAREEAVEKHEKASNHISSLVFELNELKKGKTMGAKAA